MKTAYRLATGFLVSIHLVACTSGLLEPSTSTLTATERTVSTNPPRTATPSPLAKESQTAASYQTSIARVETRIAMTPSRTPTNTPFPSPTLTLPPTPDWLTPVALAISHPSTTATDQLIAKALARFTRIPRSYFTNAGDLFGIEIVQTVANPSWLRGDSVANTSRSLSVFFEFAPEPTTNPAATLTTDEYVNWLKSRRMLIEDAQSSEVFWVKWDDYLLHRPIEPVGWISDEVFVFSQCGNPSLCFVTAIDAREREFLFTLEVHDYP